MTYAGMYIGDEISLNGIVFNQVDESGCQWILEDLDGWWGLPEPNVPNDSRAFSEDGNYFAPGRYEARQITLSGYIVPPNGKNGAVAAALARNSLNRRLDLVRSVATLRVAESVAVPPVDEAISRIPKIANVQLIGRPLTRFESVSNVLKFNFQLRAADPRKYNETIEYAETNLLADADGRPYDKVFSYSYGEAGDGGELLAINRGSYNTFGTLRIIGPVVNPSIEHTQLGKTLSLNMTLGNNEYLDINLRDRTVLFNSTASRRAALMPKSAWFWLTPGENKLRYTGSQTIPARDELPAAINYATNPSFETQFGVNSTRTNRAKRPRPYSTATDVGWTSTSDATETGLTVIGGLDPATTGAFFRRNYAVNPRPTSSTSRWFYQPGAGSTSSSVNMTALLPEDAPLPGVDTYLRRIIDVEKTSGASGWFYRSSAGDITDAGVAGDVVTVSMYVRVSQTITLFPAVEVRSGTTVVSAATLVPVVLEANVWTRISNTVTAAESYDSFQLWACMQGTSFFTGPATFDVAAVLAEKSSTVGDYFDGSFGDVNGSYDVQYQHVWTAGAEASPSDELIGVAPNAADVTGTTGFKRRIVTAPKTTGLNKIMYTSDTSDIALTSGNSITLSAYVRSNTALTVDPVGQTLLGITAVTTTNGAPVTLIPGEWTRISVTVITSGTANAFSLSANLASTQIIPRGGFLDMSAVLAEYGSVVRSYFDGSYIESNTDGKVSWSATEGQSASTLTLYNIRELGGAAAAMTFSGGGTSSVYQSTLWSSIGSASLAMNATGASSNATWALPAGTTNGLTKMLMNAGQTYTISCFIYIAEAQNPTGLHALARSIVLDVSSSSGTTTAFATSEAAPNEPGVYRLSMTFTIPGNATNAVLRLVNGSTAGTVWFDGLMIEPGSTASTSYMDGDSPFASWSGPAHNSMSTRPFVEGVAKSVIQLSYRSAWIE